MKDSMLNHQIEKIIANRFSSLVFNLSLLVGACALFIAVGARADDAPKKSEPPTAAKPDKTEDFKGDQDALIKQFPQWKEALKLKGDATTGKTFYESRTFKTVMAERKQVNFTPRTIHGPRAFPSVQ